MALFAVMIVINDKVWGTVPIKWQKWSTREALVVMIMSMRQMVLAWKNLSDADIDSDNEGDDGDCQGGSRTDK